MSEDIAEKAKQLEEKIGTSNVPPNNYSNDDYVLTGDKDIKHTKEIEFNDNV